MKEKTLQNGIRVVAVRKSSCATVSIRIFLGSGSDKETTKVLGAAHFLEHISMLRGTVNRPNAFEIYTEAGKISFNWNGDTDNASTTFFIEGYRKNFKRMLDLLSDFFIDPLLSEEGVEKEKGPVRSEIEVEDDNSMEKSQRLLDKLMYGNQPAGRLVSGTVKDLYALSRKKLQKYRKDHYLPKSTVIVVAGPIQETDVFTAVEEKFSFFKKDTLNRPKKIKTRQHQLMPKLLVFERNTKQTYFSFGFRSYPAFSKNRVALGVLRELMVRFGYRLSRKLRFEMGATYDVEVFNHLFADRGKFTISLAANSDQARDVIIAILDELNKLKRRPVSRFEKREAKLELEEVKRISLMELKDFYNESEKLTNFYGGQAAIKGAKGKILSIEEERELIKKVQVRDIYMIARKIFTNKKMNLVIVGPHKNKRQFSRVFKFK